MAAIREAVGPGIEIYIDAHGRFDLPTAVRLANRLAPYRIGWFEEPVPPEKRGAAMRLVNPAYIPRNHRLAEVIDAAVERQDFGPFEEMLEVVSRPYEERAGLERYMTPARPEECVRETFCGT